MHVPIVSPLVFDDSTLAADRNGDSDLHSILTSNAEQTTGLPAPSRERLWHDMEISPFSAPDAILCSVRQTVEDCLVLVMPMRKICRHDCG